MISEKALGQTLRKLNRLAGMLYDRIFLPVGDIAVSFYATKEVRHAPPPTQAYGPLPADNTWGGEGVYGWFAGQYTVPDALAETPLYLFPKIGGYEATLWVDGVITSNYASKILVGSHGNHYAKRFTDGAAAGTALRIELEYYAYHDMPGTQPFMNEAQASYTYPIGSVDVCTRNDLYMAYWADLRTLLSLIDALPETSFRRADVLYTLHKVHEALYLDPDHAPEGAFDAALRETHPMLTAQLAKQNGPSAPFVGLIGHSHMDTAWLWPMAETVKKCARTYAGQLQLLDQYPEYRFIQSSVCHLDWMRRDYPELFARIKDAIAGGRWEPNGGAWVECDCNLTGGEYMVRQFVWGQRFTQEHFGYRADTFWLPDTFGYSYAIPQIMKGSGIDYFLTTKLAWNDATHFPYTTFLWQGMDGTRVLTHLNRTHLGPEAALLNDLTETGAITDDPIMEKTVSNMRLFSYGKGDGGGGPEFEMVEMSRRLGDLEGIARSEHLNVSDFMHRLEDTMREPSVYAGELYLELHRGTLTNQHDIKRNNRLAEIWLHNLELLTVSAATQAKAPASRSAIAPLMADLLVNQFHDILPGTCIQSVHDLSKAQTSAVIRQAQEMAQALLASPGSAETTLQNTTSFARADTVYLPRRPGQRIAGSLAQQMVRTVDGEEMLAISGVAIPALGSTTLTWEAGEPQQADSPFQLDGNTLTTPFAQIKFDAFGAIASYVDRETGRELRHPEGYALNTFLMAEEVSAGWDNWDIDADGMAKFAPSAVLLSREVVSQGPVELRIRSHYRISERSEITQDMILSATSPQITFDTVIDWHDVHRFIKTAFDTTLIADGARHEIQFGYIRRSNHRSTDTEKSRFEVCNHKYTDLSEAGYGIALLNDCKYGISVEEGSMRLSLHKGGILPDSSGDMGRHRCRYAFLPHAGGFDVKNVVEPAYLFNYPPVQADGAKALPALFAIETESVVVETIKPCEDTAGAYIVRLYEASGAHTQATLHFSHPVVELTETNLLEEPVNALPAGQEVSLTFSPFEIKTIRVAYPVG